MKASEKKDQIKFGMKYTTEEIKKGIVISFLKESQIARSASEAISVINSFQGLTVNRYAEEYLSRLFAGEDVSYELKTTGCGKYGVQFHPAMADTIEKHNQLYELRRQKERERRIKAEKERIERLRAEFTEEKRGWYRVQVEVTALAMPADRRRYLDYSGFGIANSKMDAYNTFGRTLHDDCAKKCLIYESHSGWSSPNTKVDFLGMKTDEGYSIEAWEEYMDKK